MTKPWQDPDIPEQAFANWRQRQCEMLDEVLLLRECHQNDIILPGITLHLPV